MECRIDDCTVHYLERGVGRPVIVLHGAGVDHREAEACFEPALAAVGGLRRIYPDLPGMGRTPAPATLRSADDILGLLLDFTTAVAGREPFLLIGHSAGAYFAHGIAASRPDQITGLALVCPLLPGDYDVPEHRMVFGAPGLGDEEFRNYFVVHTPEMLARYQQFVAPAADLVDASAIERIGERWILTLPHGPAYAKPTLVIAGRQDSTVGYEAAIGLLRHYPRATLAVIDGAGHALPHEQPTLLAALLHEWLNRTAPGPTPSNVSASRDVNAERS